jgi:hypothetical protein
VPDSLERLLRQAMAKDPAARPQTAMELIRGLQTVEQELRLPVTQPILPASDPGDRDSGQSTGPHTLSTRAVGDSTIVRGLPAVDNTGGVRVARHGPAQPADPWLIDGGPGGRVRQFPPEAPESATLARPRAVVPGGEAGQDGPGRAHPAGPRAGDAGRQGGGKSRRVLALSGGGVLLALVAVVAVLGHGHGGGSPAPGLTASRPPTQPGIAGDPLGLGPGTPTVTARGVGGQQVEFSWVYVNSASSDSFRVQVNGESGKSARPKKPDLVLTVAQGQRVCIQVQVISTGGVTSPESSVSCWPKS